MTAIDYNLKHRVAAIEAAQPQQSGTPVAADFATLPGTVKGPIYCTGDSKLYYLLADGTTVKKTAALT